MSDALLVGATGLIGKAVVARTASRPLTILARRDIDGFAPRQKMIVAPSEQWADIVAAERPALLISCLGTTIGQAGSREAFRAVDQDLVLAVARSAKRAGASRMILVSSVGASPKSGNFYLRTKGEVEDALRDLAFDRLDILRPGLLTGDRSGPPRPGERLAMIASLLTDALMHGSARRYRSIAAEVVARAIAGLLSAPGEGTHVHENDAIRALAD